MTVKIPYTLKFDYEYGRVDQLTPYVRRVIANNPSAFTFRGTGTYIIGKGKVAVIDPGPVLDDHIDVLMKTLANEEVSHILITHTHMDHSPAAKPLKAFWNVKTYAYGPHGAGKLEQGVPVEEGGDMEFEPDVRIKHGDIIKGDGWTIECIYTPGHTSNHICFALKEENAIFTGDHVMGWSTSVIAPPDGDMNQYMDSLHLLMQRDEETYWPTHGTCIRDVKNYVQAFIDHRLNREHQIIDCLGRGYFVIENSVVVSVGEPHPVKPIRGNRIAFN